MSACLLRLDVAVVLAVEVGTDAVVDDVGDAVLGIGRGLAPPQSRTEEEVVPADGCREEEEARERVSAVAQGRGRRRDSRQRPSKGRHRQGVAERVKKNAL